MRTLRAAPPREHEVVFELERFERIGTRLEIEGRWAGVRGRLFMRPSLDVGSERLLAVLDHKPWAAEDHRLWRVAFELEHRDDAMRSGSELAVASDLSVILPAPGPDAARGDAPVAVDEDPLAVALAERDAARRERDTALTELAEARAALERLRSHT